MAPPRRRSRLALTETLHKVPESFDFFQAVRLLEWAASRDARDPRLAPRKPVGQDHDPRKEVVRFRSHVSLSYPGDPIVAVKEGQEGAPPEMTVTFLGLTGPSGVLPQHYTEILIRSLREKSRAMRDFYDLFHHRTISLFYRAWAKYRLPVTFEQAPQGGTDPVTGILSALVGLRTDHLGGRLAFDDSVVLHYAGLFGHAPRSASGLQAMLSDFLGRPARIVQFQGTWLFLSRDQQTCLPSAANPDGRFCRLGVDATVGERAWEVQGGFRICIGPLTYTQFLEFMPGRESMRRLAHMVRLYVGPDMDFDVRITLARAEVPECRLAAEGAHEPRLGWNTWLLAGEAVTDRDEAVFRPGDL